MGQSIQQKRALQLQLDREERLPLVAVQNGPSGLSGRSDQNGPSVPSEPSEPSVPDERKRATVFIVRYTVLTGSAA